MKNKKGFTLIELLAVIAILGVLAVISVVAVESTLKNSKNKANQIQDEIIQKAVRAYMADNNNCRKSGECMVTIQDLIDNGYIENKEGLNKDQTFSIIKKDNNYVAGLVHNFNYTGNPQEITLPAGKYKLEVWGAQGGNTTGVVNGFVNNSGLGGYSYGILSITSPTKLYIYVGGQGGMAPGSTSYVKVSGGFNGGGFATHTGTSEPGNGGGGASDIRIGQDSLYSRVIVAGGGGGSGEDNEIGGYGGGSTGGPGNGNLAITQASQSTAGQYASFGNGGNTINGGAGGGGWYGGASRHQVTNYSASGTDSEGGGGGSGYVYTSSTASNYPSGCLLNSSYYLTNAQTIAGNQTFKSPSGEDETGHSGNGYARITEQ